MLIGGKMKRCRNKRIKNKFIGSFVYYIRMILFLHKMPIKLRQVDIQNLIDDIQTTRNISDKELDEYVAHLKTYI